VSQAETLCFSRRGDGAPVFFLHGFFSDARLWDPLIDQLSSGRRFTAITPDLPGHGRAAGWRGDWTALLDQIETAVAAETEPVTLIGYSMGARILRRLLLRRGVEFEHAVLIAPHPGFEEAEASARRLDDDRLAARLLAQPIETSVAEWRVQPIFAGQSRIDTKALQRQDELRLAQDRQGLAFALRQFGSGTCMAGGQIQRDASVTLIHGDRISDDVERAERLQSLWSEARRVTLAGLGHNPILEDPQALVDHLTTAALGARR
jgi:pimeloyl-ACP methyl ester carboxylesterase